MPEVSIDIEVYCSCGEGLCNQSTGDSGRYGPKVTVEPCLKCQSEEYERGYEEGYKEARKELDQD